MADLYIFYLGTVEYSRGLELQTEIASLRLGREVEDCVLLLQHPPTVTRGRIAKHEHLLASRDQLLAEGIDLVETDRGGDITYHGPGQLVGYPIFDLNEHGRDLHTFLRRLEQALINALSEFDIAAGRLPPNTGVWVEDRKIAAIGIKVSRWISTHGFALNVDPIMYHFNLIVPCGIHDFGVTSMSAELRKPINVTDALNPVSSAIREVFGGNELGNKCLAGSLAKRLRTSFPEMLIL
jgi:lipoate-protein ligase B